MLFSRPPARNDIDREHDRALSESLANVDRFAEEHALSADEYAQCVAAVRERLDTWRSRASGDRP